jgi:hypothetical protein
MAGRHEEAMWKIEKVMAFGDDTMLHLLKGDILQEMGRYDHALIEYLTALRPFMRNRVGWWR